MKEITLTRGKVSLVDDEDHEWLCTLKWYANRIERTGRATLWYAMHDHTLMHRFIMQKHGIEAFQFDHIDSNGLNNQKSNIRPATQSQNNANRRKESNCSSKFKGVSWNSSRKYWVSRLRKEGKTVFQGWFDNEIEAALKYDEAAREHYGSFAWVNFP